MTEWKPDSWRQKTARQQVVYPDQAALQRVVEDMAKLPPLVTSWEVEALKGSLAAAARGDAFLLQGGDCAESFDDCNSDKIANKLKILLQMSVVLIHGTRKPVVRVGRIAGQYAKPRSSAEESKGGRHPPDLSRRPGQPLGLHHRGAHPPDPQLLLRWLRARRAHAELHPGAGRRRVRRPAPPGELEGPVRRRQQVPGGVRGADRLGPRLDLLHGGDHRLRVFQAARGRLLHEPRGARARLRDGADAAGSPPGRLVQPIHPLSRGSGCEPPTRMVPTSSTAAASGTRSGSSAARR